MFAKFRTVLGCLLVCCIVPSVVAQSSQSVLYSVPSGGQGSNCPKQSTYKAALSNDSALHKDSASSTYEKGKTQGIAPPDPGCNNTHPQRIPLPPKAPKIGTQNVNDSYPQQ